MQREPLKTISIATIGSRGDIQPYIAIAIQLKNAGYNVWFITNEDHCPFCQSFGFQASPTFDGVRESVESDPDIRRAMADGNARDFFAMLSINGKKRGPPQLERFVKEITARPPQLLLVGTLADYFGEYAKYILNVPILHVKTLIITYTNKDRAPLGFPTLPFGLHRYLMRHLILGGMYKSWKLLDRDGASQIGDGGGVTDYVSKQRYISEIIAPLHPRIVFQPSKFNELVHSGCTHANFRFVGPAVIDSSQQQNNTAGFGTSETREQIEGFFEKDPKRKPVYCGWGSMICRSPQYMVELVVRALMMSGRRGIVLSGWAGLTMNMLESATDDKNVVEYAKKNVIFVSEAPHEWLFPRVACTVHHGGQGTMSSALRAGVPTIVTPVFLDQFDSAYMVQKLGVGIGFDVQLQKITSEKLGAAIAEVLDKEAFLRRAREVQIEVTAENGAANVVLEIRSFWDDDIMSGKYDKGVMEVKKQAQQVKLKAFLLSNIYCAIGFALIATLVGASVLVTQRTGEAFQSWSSRASLLV